LRIRNKVNSKWIGLLNYRIKCKWWKSNLLRKSSEIQKC